MIECEKSVVIWGDGEQTRSFLYIDDCIDAVRLLMKSDFTGPVNIGSEEMVTINELTSMACTCAHKELDFVHDMTKPQGVRGRNSDNKLIREKLGWEPKYSLFDGMVKTFDWIESQIVASRAQAVTPELREKPARRRTTRGPHRRKSTGRSPAYN